MMKRGSLASLLLDVREHVKGCTLVLSRLQHAHLIPPLPPLEELHSSSRCCNEVFDETSEPVRSLCVMEGLGFRVCCRVFRVPGLAIGVVGLTVEVVLLE